MAISRKDVVIVADYRYFRSFLRPWSFAHHMVGGRGMLAEDALAWRTFQISSPVNCWAGSHYCTTWQGVSKIAYSSRNAPLGSAAPRKTPQSLVGQNKPNNNTRKKNPLHFFHFFHTNPCVCSYVRLLLVWCPLHFWASLLSISVLRCHFNFSCLFRNSFAAASKLFGVVTYGVSNPVTYTDTIEQSPKNKAE